MTRNLTTKREDEPIITIHHSRDIKPETMQALGEMMKILYMQAVNDQLDNGFERFKKAVKVIVSVPKSKVKNVSKKTNG